MIDLKTKKILVTGGDGFIGRHLTRYLIIHRGVLPKNISTAPISKYDLREMSSCQKAVKDQDIVIHLAAVTGNGEFHRLNPGKIFYDNAIMAINLMEAARRAGVEKFIGIGSVTEYPEKSKTLLKEEDIWNGYPEATHAPYSFAKKMLIIQSTAYRQQYGFNSINLLLTNIFGPGMDFGGNSYVIPSVIEKIKKAQEEGKNTITLWGTGKSIRDFLYAEDAAEGICLALDKYDLSEPINLASGEGIMIKDLVKIICRLMNFNGNVEWDKTKPGDQLRRLISINRARKNLNFKPKVHLEEGLEKTIKWYQSLIK